MFVGTTEGKLFFPSFIEALWTLYICVTTANYPDVMMDAYNENRWTAIYFVSFMVISFFFFMNVILASITNEYDTMVEDRAIDAAKARDENLKKAFQLMDVKKQGYIDKPIIMKFFDILNNDFYEFRTLSKEETVLLFAILDKDGSGSIEENEFIEFGNILLLEFSQASDYESPIKKFFPRFFETNIFQSFCRIVEAPSFEKAIDAIIFLNAILIGIQSYPELSGQAVTLDERSWDGEVDTVWELLELILSTVYVLEVLSKISVFGTKRYFESAKNIFDFTITVLAVVASAVVYIPNDISNSRLIRMVIVARVLRLLRLLTSMKQFRLIGSISAEILPKATGVITVLSSLLYIFSAVGVGLYGGLITRDPNNPLSYLILDTEFSNNIYWGNNFNDMTSAMNVMFNLLVINNWTECEEGFEAVTGNKWVRFYFLAFHILGVILINNLVIAFVINNFLEQLAIQRENGGSDREVVFNASCVTGTSTGLKGNYVAHYNKRYTIRRNSSEAGGGSMRDEDRLQLLFGQSEPIVE